MHAGEREAIRRVERAAAERSTALDLNGLGLTALPGGIAGLVQLTDLDLSGNRLAELPDWLTDLTALCKLWLADNRFTALPSVVRGLTTLADLAVPGNRLAELPDWLPELTALSTLSLSRNELAVVPDWIAEFTGLTSLDLGGNRFAALPDWLGDLTDLTELYLDQNRLAELPRWLAKLTNLTRLDIDNNRLAELPDWLTGLGALRWLDLTGNRLRTLPAWLGELADLKTLPLGDNQLAELPESLARLGNLTALCLDDNDLGQLPAWLGELTNLTELQIGSNRLSGIPDSLANLTKLTRLDLDGNELSSVPDWIGGLADLETLHLGGNQLTELPATFRQLTKLKILGLYRNRLTAFPEWLRELPELSILFMDDNGLETVPEWVGELTSLTELGVGGNPVATLPASIGNLTGLLALWIPGNRLTELPEWLRGLTKLSRLYCGRNKITVLPDWIGELAELTLLELGNNELTALPAGFANLRMLSTLQLGDNQFTELPDWLGELTGLTRLTLTNLGLTEVPHWITGLTGLVSLDLGENRLTELPADLGRLAALSNISLYENQLSALPDSMAELTGLTQLGLRNNQITEVPEWLRNALDLNSLYLNNNQIETLPDWLGELTGLINLYVGSNRITEVSGWLGNLTGLRELDLSGNQLTELPDCLGQLPGLDVLYLENNCLRVLPDSLARLTRLRKLSMHDNLLSKLPDWLARLPELETLLVSRNPLVSPPPEIATAGTRSIVAFILARQQGSSAQWVSKLLVVGEGGVGKTSLIKALSGQPYDPGEPTTHGLRIEHLNVDHPDRPDVRMRLAAWDFGGQQIYHATHQFFLSNRSLFLLLWNSRLGWEQGKLRYWLDIIKARAPQSPIILVATHTLGRPVDLPLDELRREYPRIVDSLAVDNSTGDGIAELHAKLAERAAELPLMGSEWPTTWLAAADALRKSPDKYVTPERMWQLMAAAGVGNPQHQRFIASALHQLGDILYYGDDPELMETVVLRPEWVNEYISKVLDSDEVASAYGLLSRDHLAELWSDLDRGLRDHFLGMMDKYDLSYRIEGGATGDVSLVVERLSWSEPSYQDSWDEIGRQDGTHQIRVLYRLNTMPPGIPTWFIARSHRFSTNTHWRSGALLRHTDGRHLALLRADRHRNTVELAVRGPRPAAFFSVLDDGLSRTLERFPGLDIAREVPCPCQDATGGVCPEVFDYDDLNRRLERVPPRHEIECRKSGEDVDVRSLLFGLAPSEREQTSVAIERMAKKLENFGGQLAEQTEFAQRMFLKLQGLIQEQQETRCPSVFALVPAKRRRVARTVYELHLYCEEPGSWHRLPEPEGCYEINQPAEWLRRFGPYLNHLLTVLRHAAPLAGPVLGVAVATLDGHLKADCDLMKELISQIPTGFGQVDDDLDSLKHGDADPGPAARASSEADFRELSVLLDKLDPDRHWGGLSRTVTPEGLTLYLCADHLAQYREAGRS